MKLTSEFMAFKMKLRRVARWLEIYGRHLLLTNESMTVTGAPG